MTVSTHYYGDDCTPPHTLAAAPATIEGECLSCETQVRSEGGRAVDHPAPQYRLCPGSGLPTVPDDDTATTRRKALAMMTRMTEYAEQVRRAAEAAGMSYVATVQHHGSRIVEARFEAHFYREVIEGGSWWPAALSAMRTLMTNRSSASPLVMWELEAERAAARSFLKSISCYTVLTIDSNNPREVMLAELWPSA